MMVHSSCTTYNNTQKLSWMPRHTFEAVFECQFLSATDGLCCFDINPALTGHGRAIGVLRAINESALIADEAGVDRATVLLAEVVEVGATQCGLDQRYFLSR